MGSDTSSTDEGASGASSVQSCITAHGVDPRATTPLRRPIAKIVFTSPRPLLLTPFPNSVDPRLHPVAKIPQPGLSEMPFTVVRSTPPTVIPRAPTSRTPVAPFPLIVDDWTTVLVSDPAASRPKKPLSTITSPAACPPVTESREPGRPPADYGRPGRLRQYR